MPTIDECVSTWGMIETFIKCQRCTNTRYKGLRCPECKGNCFWDYTSNCFVYHRYYLLLTIKAI